MRFRISTRADLPFSFNLDSMGSTQDKTMSGSGYPRIKGLGRWFLIALVIMLAVAGLKFAGASAVYASLASGMRDGAAAPVRPRGSVREELTRLQKQTGLTVAWYSDELDMVSFKNRSLIKGKNFFHTSRSLMGAITRDGAEIAVPYQTSFFVLSSLFIMRPDGTEIKRFPGIHADFDLCWSHDDSRLAMTSFRGASKTSLEILDLNSNLTTSINPQVEEWPHFTSQCWSPDNKRIVYQIDGTVSIYDIETGVSKKLATGSNPKTRKDGQEANPTWSPDGNWIAYLDNDMYYAIRPDGRDKKKLFHKGGAASGLVWSPDGRFVAYVSELGFFEGGFLQLDVEFYKLRVRRLEDNSEDWVVYSGPGTDYQWVTSPELKSH